MASVSKDQRWTRYWYAHFTDALGRRRKKSTGLTSRSKALEMAQGLQRAANEARRGALTEARTRELLSEILQSVSGEGLRMFTVAEWFEHFVSQKKKSRSSRTASRHAQTMREFIDFLGHRAKLNIAAITARDIASFRDHRQNQGLAPATVNLDVGILSAAFNSALRQGYISINPCAAVEPVKDNAAQRKSVFTPRQVSALISAADADWRGAVLVGFYCGQRLRDCTNLRWRNIDLVSAIKTIRFTVSKTGREIVVAVHPVLEDFLLSLPTAKNDDEFLFPSLAGREAPSLSKAFARIMERARIEQHVIRERSRSGRSVHALSFHSLRHSFSSILANSGISEELRMTLVGHRSKAIHQQYSHHDLSRLRDAVAVLPRV
jgi:integrase